VAYTINATAAALLGLLRDQPASGYSLTQRAQTEFGNYWSVTRSQVYRELAVLAEQGLVTVKEAGQRSKREHALTDAGRAAFRAWLPSEPGPEVVRIPLLLRLAFADELEDAQLHGLIDAVRTTHEQRLARYRELEIAALAAGSSARELNSLRFGLRYEKAVLRWFEKDLA